MFNRKSDILGLEGSDEPVISIITNDFNEGDCTIDEKELKEELPILPLRNTVMFPGTSMPIAVGREKSKKIINSLNKKRGKLVGLICQKDAEHEDPDREDLFGVGVIGEIIRVIELPGSENITVLFQAKKRYEQ